MTSESIVLWDVFQAYRLYGGWGAMAQYVYVLEGDKQKVLFKSNLDYEIGVEEEISLTETGYLPERERKFVTFVPVMKGIVTRRISKDDFEAFDLSTADDDTINAIGEFMCGVCIHGQWFGGLIRAVRNSGSMGSK